MDKAKIQQGARLILEGLGVDLTGDNFRTTPERYAKVFEEVFEPPKTSWPVFNENYTDLVMLKGYVFYTFCPHHLLPVRLVASIAYIPNGKVIGASKLARLVHLCNRKPETQEALTSKIIQAVTDITNGSSLGAAVHLQGEHGCMRIRGIHSQAPLLTWKFSGRFESDATLQRQFMETATR